MYIKIINKILIFLICSIFLFEQIILAKGDNFIYNKSSSKGFEDKLSPLSQLQVNSNSNLIYETIVVSYSQEVPFELSKFIQKEIRTNFNDPEVLKFIDSIHILRLKNYFVFYVSEQNQDLEQG